jgi:uncharacterized lipoprotein YajG
MTKNIRYFITLILIIMKNLLVIALLSSFAFVMTGCSMSPKVEEATNTAPAATTDTVVPAPAAEQAAMDAAKAAEQAAMDAAKAAQQAAMDAANAATGADATSGAMAPTSGAMAQ